MVQSWNLNTLESLQRRERHPALKHARVAPPPAVPAKDKLAARRFVVPYDAPATRLSEPLSLPFKANVMLTEAAIVLRGVRDGQAELLMYDLTGTHILASHEYRPQSGMLTLHLLREDTAANYQRVLRSLRYINRAAAPTPGLRTVLYRVTDLTGDVQHVHAAALDVEGAPIGIESAAETRAPNPDREPSFAGLAAQALPEEAPVPSAEMVEDWSTAERTTGVADDAAPTTLDVPSEPVPTAPEVFPIAEPAPAAIVDAFDKTPGFAAGDAYRIFGGGEIDASVPPWQRVRTLLASAETVPEAPILAETRDAFVIFSAQKPQLPAEDLGFDVVDAGAIHLPLRGPANDQRAPRRPLTMEDMFEADVGEGELGHYFGQPLDGSKKFGPVAMAVAPRAADAAPPIAIAI